MPRKLVVVVCFILLGLTLCLWAYTHMEHETYVHKHGRHVAGLKAGSGHIQMALVIGDNVPVEAGPGRALLTPLPDGFNRFARRSEWWDWEWIRIYVWLPESALFGTQWYPTVRRYGTPAYHAFRWRVRFWFVAAVFAAYPLYVRLTRTRHRRRRGLCPKCGYDLTGNVSGTCPECGRIVEKATRKTA